MMSDADEKEEGMMFHRTIGVVAALILAFGYLGCSDGADDDGGDDDGADDDGADDDGGDDDGADDDGGDDDGGDDDGGDDDGGDDDSGDDDTEWDPADFAFVWEIGPGQTYETPCDAPWESLQPDTLVLIHHRPDPYRCKWVITVTATEQDPVVVQGVPDGDQLPVISGDAATTPPGLNYWNEDRSVIKVGGSSQPDSSNTPAYIHIESLSIRSGRPSYSFTDASGSQDTYAENAAAIHVEQGEHVTIRGCELHDSATGFFASSDGVELLLHGSYIHDNGIEGNSYRNNNYTEAAGITFEFNHFGPLRPGCDGSNLKDRSAGTVIRYNWIEGGNRQLDLVESDHADLIGDPAYATTFVYGNVLIEPEDAGNSQIVHYGGDGGDTSMYRKGMLYFFHNTVVSTRSDYTTLLRLSTADESADVRGNIVYVTESGSHLAITNDDGTIELRDNWLPAGWVDCHGTPSGTVSDLGNLTGSDPGFTDAGGQDFHLAPGAAGLDAAGPLAPEVLPAHDLLEQYVVHQAGEPRPDDGSPDIGAFERP